METIIPNQALYTDRFISAEESKQLQAELIETSDWRHESLRMRGVLVPFPRMVAWHGDQGVTYRYSRTTNISKGWTPALRQVRAKLHEKFPELPFNGVLLNYYRSGRDSIGRHADDEKDLVPGAPIIAVSLGVTRTLRFRPVGGTAKDEIRLPLRDGSMLMMFGECQSKYTHEIKKEPNVDGERISLTFRCIR